MSGPVDKLTEPQRRMLQRGRHENGAAIGRGQQKTADRLVELGLGTVRHSHDYHYAFFAARR